MGISDTLKVTPSRLEREFSENPKYKRYEAQLKSIDKNGDGVIDISELCQLIDELATVEKQRHLLKWAVIITGIFALLTIAAVVGSVYAVVVLTKDTNVSSQGIMMTKDSVATPVITGQMIALDSLDNLYTKSLDDMANISFLKIPSADGGSIVHVAEIKLVANTSATITTDTGSVYVVDASGIHEQVASKTTGSTSMRKLLQTSDPASSGSNSNCLCMKKIVCNNYAQDPSNMGCHFEYVNCVCR